jgi:hypothetical protein
MLKTDELLARLRSVVPEMLETALVQRPDLISGDANVRVAFVGAFSTGKSSLVNMLLGETLLASALEESTAIPVYVEQGDRALCLAMTDGQMFRLEAEQFSAATVDPPANANYASVSLPLSWLEGLCILDLPGLGGLLDAQQAYATAQVRKSDAVVYLLDPRGPTAADLKVLTAIRQFGKRVKVMVARWDEVESAVRNGERAPPLDSWSAQIEAGAGLRLRVGCCNRNGLGKGEILDFLQRAVADRDQIRARQLTAELEPLLANEMASLGEERRILDAASQSNARDLQTQLLAQKSELSQLKESLHRSQVEERDRVLTRCGEVRDAQREEMATRLKAAREELSAGGAWEEFEQRGQEQLREYLSRLAAHLSELSASYGRARNFSPAADALNVRLPTPQSIEIQDFLDMASIMQLQEEVERQSQRVAEAESAISAQPLVSAQGPEQKLRALLEERQRLASMALPKVIREVSGKGASWGRLAGELADIGLIFVNPAAAATKIASLLGRGAKNLKIPLDKEALASSIHGGIQRTQQRRLGDWLASVQSRTVDKVKDLETLSLSYWGERLGAALGGKAFEEVTDPEAERERSRQLNELEAQISALRQELARQEDIQNEAELKGTALEASRATQARLTAELAERLQEAEQQRQEAAEHARRRREEQMLRHGQRATEVWMRSFDTHALHMIGLLEQHIDTHWTERSATAIRNREEMVGRLLVEIAQSPQERAAALEELQASERRIQAGIDIIAAHVGV